ncbi:hypothetical protein ACYULU_04225 [Breznakiellaceae bacterium SP9]
MAKFRMGFCSNSSSSSFVIFFKGDKKQLAERLKPIMEVPKDHCLHGIAKEASEVLINCIDEEYVAPEAVKEHWNPDQESEFIEKIQDGFHVFTGAFSDTNGSIEDLFCNEGLHYTSNDLIIECEGGY